MRARSEASTRMSDQQPESSAQPDESQQSDDSTSKQELDEGEPGDVGDAQLPADMQPAEDNPLARHPGQSGDEDDEIGADREGEPEKAPLTEEDSDYGGSSDGS